MLLLVTLCGIVTVLILGYMAFLFWRDPQDGLAQTTHRVELLPQVMADRYTAFAVLAVVLTLYGDLWLMVRLVRSLRLHGICRRADLQAGRGGAYETHGLGHFVCRGFGGHTARDCAELTPSRR